MKIHIVKLHTAKMKGGNNIQETTQQPSPNTLNLPSDLPEESNVRLQQRAYINIIELPNVPLTSPKRLLVRR